MELIILETLCNVNHLNDSFFCRGVGATSETAGLQQMQNKMDPCGFERRQKDLALVELFAKLLLAGST